MLKEFIAQKVWVIPAAPSLAIVIDTIEFAVEEIPKFHHGNDVHLMFRTYYPGIGKETMTDCIETLGDDLTYFSKADITAVLTHEVIPGQWPHS